MKVRGRKGSAYLMVMASMLIASLGISLLLSRHRTRRFKIRALRSRFQVLSAAEAGVTLLYHRLKGVPFSEIHSLELQAQDTMDGTPYVAAMSPDTALRTVVISSTASLGKVRKTISAVAVYKTRKVGRIEHYRWSLRYSN